MTDQQFIVELARAIGCVASGNAPEAHAIVRQLAGAGAQVALPGIAAPEAKPKSEDQRKSDTMRLFRYWQTECGHPTAKATPERISKIMGRLREGYSVAEIAKAIDGAKHAAYESDGKRYDDLELICRNGTKLEDFIARGEKHSGAIEVEAAPVGGLEEQIAALRRTMAMLRRDGRTTEYEAHERDLKALMAKRGEK